MNTYALSSQNPKMMPIPFRSRQTTDRRSIGIDLFGTVLEASTCRQAPCVIVVVDAFGILVRTTVRVQTYLSNSTPSFRPFLSRQTNKQTTFQWISLLLGRWHYGTDDRRPYAKKRKIITLEIKDRVKGKGGGRRKASPG
jgi:hypothetical protein